MGQLRRAISLVFALGLLAAGFGFLAYLLFFAPGWRGWIIIGSGFSGAIGALWLYEDITLRPTRRDRDEGFGPGTLRPQRRTQIGTKWIEA